MNDFLIKNDVLLKYLGAGGEVTVPDGVVGIGDCAFKGCVCLTSVLFPDSLEFIGNEAFENCANLEAVTFNGGFVDIGERAFRSCPNLRGIVCFNDADFEYPAVVFGFEGEEQAAAFDVPPSELKIVDIILPTMPDFS